LSTLIWTWLIVTQASALASVAVIPYLSSGRTRPKLLVRTWVISQLVFGTTVALGLAAGRQLGLGAPVIEAVVGGMPVPPLAWPLACFVGVALAAVLGIVDIVAFGPARAPLRSRLTPTPPVLARLGALLYGGIAEEALMRLGCLTIVAFVAQIPLRPVGEMSRSIAVGIGIVVSTAIFALGHLPRTGQMAPLTRGLVVRALVLNSLAGLVFGTLYVAFGLEAAVIAHGAADFVLVLLLPWMRNRRARAKGHDGGSSCS
jgi:membrane protease YdiL (CAAX protease family)